jgi:succinate dehydrogenase / fumarate reductase cytochrome b subunit
VASIFQTLGLRSKKATSLISRLSWGYSIAIWIGFVSIPVSILLGIVK